jgi:hypothetical protein
MLHKKEISYFTLKIHYKCAKPIKFVQNMKDYQGDTNNSKLCRVIRQFHKIATSDCQFCHVCPSLSPHGTANNSAPNRTICIKFIWVFFDKVSLQFNCHCNSTFITIQVSLQSANNNRQALYIQTDIHL